MSLFATLNQSSGAMRVAQAGLQVTGNNISNANTPGYIRQQLIQMPAGVARVGDLLVGHGVQAHGIRQQIDLALADRLRSASSQLVSSETVEEAYSDLEAVIGALDENDLGGQLSTFNNALHDLMNQPHSTGVRQMVVLNGQRLAEQFQRLRRDASTLRSDADRQIFDSADDINRLASKIAELNVRIVSLEGGRTLGSDATGLRDQRQMAMDELAELVDIQVQEQPSGSVTVFVNGDYLVSESNSREVFAAELTDGRTGHELRIVETDSRLQIREGRIAGAYRARDEVAGGFLAELDTLAADVARAVNLVHSQGQGARGFTELTSVVGATDAEAPLDAAGLDFAPSNGRFHVRLHDSEGQLISEHAVPIDLVSSSGRSTMRSVADALDAIDGVAAEVLADGRLSLSTEDPGQQFSFADDTSGFLAAAGINTFFVGTDARQLDVNPLLAAAPEMLATSLDGPGEDTANLESLVDLVDRPQEALGGASIRKRYERMAAETTQAVSVQRSIADGLRTYHGGLESDHLSGTAVNINEEAIKMLSYQRAFQASARVVAATSEMLETLVNL